MFSIERVKDVSLWRKSDDTVLKLIVGADIGGSGIRMRISDFADPKRYVDLGHCKAKSTKELLDIIEDLSSKMKDVIQKYETVGSAMAVAGPIKDGEVVMTNWTGDPSVRTLSLSQLPGDLFPPKKSVFLNDLEAGAYGIVAADKLGILNDNFKQLWEERAPKGSIIGERTAVLAMGSGLGVALIVKNPMTSEPIVLPTELGHLQIPSVCCAHPNCELEKALVQHISEHYYAGEKCPEYEDISSGRGLELAYQYFNLVETGKKVPLEQISAGNIATLAQEGDAVARNSLLWHYKMFIRSAKSIATSLSCDSVILALDNQVKNDWFVKSVEKELGEEFYQFIRPDWMNNIRAYSQTKILNFNILGTDYMARFFGK